MRPWLALGLFVAWLAVSVAPSEAACPTGARIAVSHDGNMHDLDDITASAMMVAILAKAGAAPHVVFFGHSDHFWWSDATREEKMRVSSVETARRFGGFDLTRFFNVTQNLSAARATLTAEINKSSSLDRLYVLAAGPMELVGQAIEAADPAKRQFVTLVSHSAGWNDSHAQDAIEINEPGSQTLVGWTFSEIDADGVQGVKITNGNLQLRTDSSAWTWLRDAADANLRWLWCRHLANQCPEFSGFVGGAGQGVFDASDATMGYWVVTGGMNFGDQVATPQKLQALFTGSSDPPPPPPPPPPSTYSLVVSASPTRTNPLALHGRTISGTVYIFTTPETNVDTVRFLHNGATGLLENNPPFDFKGGSVTAANPWHTTSVLNGTHRISAVLRFFDGTTQTIVADVVVNN